MLSTKINLYFYLEKSIRLDSSQLRDENGWSSSCAVEPNFEWIGGSLVRADAWRDKWGDGIRISYK